MKSAASLFPTLAAMDRRTRFLLGYVVALAMCVAFHIWGLGWLDDTALATKIKLAEVERTERISKQTWWLEEDRVARAEIDAAKARFWKGETIGLVRAEIEAFIQQQLTKNGLKAQTIVVDNKITDAKGVPLLRAQIKLIGQTAGLIGLLDDLGKGSMELFMTGVNLQIRGAECMAEITIDAPTIAAKI